MTDLKDKTVEELRKDVYLALYHGAPYRPDDAINAFDIVARRLEEAQQFNKGFSIREKILVSEKELLEARKDFQEWLDAINFRYDSVKRERDEAQKQTFGTSSDYIGAYQKEKTRSDELRKMLDEQIQHTANALREAEEAQKQIVAQPWPPKDFVIKLSEAADILLNDLDYDGHGWEEIKAANDAANNWLASPSTTAHDAEIVAKV